MCCVWGSDRPAGSDSSPRNSLAAVVEEATVVFPFSPHNLKSFLRQYMGYSLYKHHQFWWNFSSIFIKKGFLEMNILSSLGCLFTASLS